jgi:hypothetical protein
VWSTIREVRRIKDFKYRATIASMFLGIKYKTRLNKFRGIGGRHLGNIRDVFSFFSNSTRHQRAIKFVKDLMLTEYGNAALVQKMRQFRIDFSFI